MAGTGYERAVTRKLCEILSQTRALKGLTQETVARKIGRRQAFVSNYERGEKRLTVSEFLEISEALGLDPSTVIADLQAWTKRG